jgi:hypothetical protein
LTFWSSAEEPGTKWPSAPTASPPSIRVPRNERGRPARADRASADGAPGSVLASGGDPSVAAGRAAAPGPGLGGRRAHNATAARAAAASTTSDVRTVRVPRSSGGWRARGGCPRELDVLQTGLGLRALADPDAQGDGSPRNWPLGKISCRRPFLTLRSAVLPRVRGVGRWTASRGRSRRWIYLLPPPWRISHGRRPWRGWRPPCRDVVAKRVPRPFSARVPQVG